LENASHVEACGDMKKGKEEIGPPAWAVTFLHWFCPDELVEGIYGDLLELYSEEKLKSNRRKANWQFVQNAMRMCHPSILLRNKFQVNTIITMGMIKSHLLVAVRTMKKHKFYSAINMIGLSLAIGFIFLVFLFVENELAYDKFHAKRDSIFRVYSRLVNVETGQIENESAVTSVPLSRDLYEELPAIESFTRFGSASAILRNNDLSYIETVNFVDTGFLEMFDFPLLSGNRTSALDLPNAVILTKETAEKYFGQSDPMNKVLTLEMGDSVANLMVTGIINSNNSKSSLQFDMLVPFDQYAMDFPVELMESYDNASIENYILMPSAGSIPEKESEITQAIQRYISRPDYKVELGMQDMSGLHLENEIVGNATYTNPLKVYILIGLALLVLLVASINFITLSMGQAMNRIAEVGVRKVLGAVRGQLRRQFIIESLLMTVVSCGVGVLLARLSLPHFNEIVDSNVQFSMGFSEVRFILILIVLIGMISGISQSVMLVGQNVSRALKGKITAFKREDRFTHGLVVFQFALSIILIIVALGMHSQMRYIQNTELGFDKERLLEISMNSSSNKEEAELLLKRFRERATENQRILAVSGAMNTFRSPWTSITISQEDGTRESMFYNQIDPNYINTMGIELLAGKDFSMGVKGSTNAILVNEALVDHFGWDDGIGKTIPGQNFEESPLIVGVFKDYHFSSMHERIEPLILAIDDKTIRKGITGISTYIWPPNLYQIIVRFGPGDIESVIRHLDDSWKSVNPDVEFVYHFVDEAIEAKYAEDKRWGKVTYISSLFAIIVAWLGLLGLVRLTVDRKTREIGIRKVLGSTTEGVIALLSRKYLVLLLVGNLIAWPIAWWLLDQWLQSFNYRITLQPLLFIASGAAVFIIVIASVSLQSLKAARANPVDSMRVD